MIMYTIYLCVYAYNIHIWLCGCIYDIHIWLCVCVCMYIYVHIWLCVCVCMYIYIHIYVYISREHHAGSSGINAYTTYIYDYVCVYTTYIYDYVVCVCTFIHMYRCIYIPWTSCRAISHEYIYNIHIEYVRVYIYINAYISMYIQPVNMKSGHLASMHIQHKSICMYIYIYNIYLCTYIPWTWHRDIWHQYIYNIPIRIYILIYIHIHIYLCVYISWTSRRDFWHQCIYNTHIYVYVYIYIYTHAHVSMYKNPVNITSGLPAPMDIRHMIFT